MKTSYLLVGFFDVYGAMSKVVNMKGYEHTLDDLVALSMWSPSSSVKALRLEDMLGN